MRSDLGKARGLGSAKDGTGHFWHQRVTAVALVPLMMWFLASIIGLIGADQAVVAGWLKTPLPAIAMILFIVTGFTHLRLGMQVVIEDYIHRDGTKILLLMLNSFFCVGIGLAATLSVLKLFLGA